MGRWTLLFAAAVVFTSVTSGQNTAGQNTRMVTGDVNQFWRFVLDSMRNRGQSSGRTSFSVVYDPSGRRTVTTSSSSSDTGSGSGIPGNIGFGTGFPRNTGSSAGFPRNTGSSTGFPRNTGSSAGFPRDTGSGSGFPGSSASTGSSTNTENPPPPPPAPAFPKPAMPKSNPIVKRPTIPMDSIIENTCTNEYKALEGHTLCMRDDSRVRVSGVSEADKKMITDLHNDYRSKVEPPATDLVTLKWDERLASVAQKWANQCKAGHDKMRKIPSIGMSVGQNVAGGYNTWEESVFHWYDEIRMWKYGVDPDSYLGHLGWKKIGHFTQMVQNATFLVGCGYAECRRSRYTRYYVCDYAAGQSNLAYPYTAARPGSGEGRCSVCPNTCNKGQCDCKGLVCLNGGKLDPNSCTCTCTKLYEGKTCEQLVCPAKDKWICRRDWPESYCDAYTNVPEECPHMCGICKSVTGSTSSSPEVTYVSSSGCQYQGVRSTLDECKAYGRGGDDIHACATKGGNITCTDCDKYYNVKRDMCPVMCGLCDPQCNGKECRNGGTLDTVTCSCSCQPPYEGDMCETVDCAIPDMPHCPYWSVGHCRQYRNVPSDCRHMCELCR
ncbi:uncharacterized protein LOC110457814 [Mizuhopecten yessoensis]|uniref:Cysteine-rich venom protein n=1 Tax=Mizuhopecten yessoensis TaxID=6573 RepID=A0A210Q7U9_MIZYE|nr:uncharacterized protein LOC110457814 [Mizuhopecten yessoensis]OWF44827.1 Cysteine-rich venom protein [Mizuhopecten yessoensis]